MQNQRAARGLGRDEADGDEETIADDTVRAEVCCALVCKVRFGFSPFDGCDRSVVCRQQRGNECHVHEQLYLTTMTMTTRIVVLAIW